MTDNFKFYRNYIEEQFNLSTLSEGDTYFVVELMRRGKDNPDLPAANYHFKNYYIRKIEDLDKYENEIKLLCEVMRLRAYASVNYKSFKQVTLNTLLELSRRVAKNDFKKNYNVYESASGSYVHSKNKRWVIDLDDCESDDEYVSVVESCINNCKPLNTNKIITKIPTRSGIHLITKPFDKEQFIEECKCNYITLKYGKTPDIKKNHLTLLYENF